MKILELQWDDENVEHIARHRVNPAEVSEVCFGLNISAKEESGRYVLSGQTGEGRYLTIVVEPLGKGIFRPITAFEMSERDKRSYRRRIRK